MSINSSVVAATGAFVLALTLGAASQPAEAGRACNELGLSSPCINGSDLKSRLNLDDGRNARVRLRDAGGENAIELNAGSASVTNLFSNDEEESNGLVKAWAQINADGTVESCWRCDKDPGETNRISAGNYEVDFTPLATDISGRPRSAVIDDLTDGNETAGVIDLADRSGDPSSIFVNTADTVGASSDRSFVLTVY
jgi:hypothetical protein